MKKNPQRKQKKERSKILLETSQKRKKKKVESKQKSHDKKLKGN